MLVLLDGSGSVNWYGPGFEQERSFTKKLFELMSFGDTGAKAQTFNYPSVSRAAQLILIETSKRCLIDVVLGTMLFSQKMTIWGELMFNVCVARVRGWAGVGACSAEGVGDGPDPAGGRLGHHCLSLSI